MMDIITGKTRPDAGEVFFDGETDLTKLDEAQIAKLGIGRKFQKPTVFESHTVATTRAGARRRRAACSPRCSTAPTPAQSGRIDEMLDTIRLAHLRTCWRGEPHPRPEAVAGDRHAAGAGPEAAAGRRAGRRHDRCRDRGDRASCCARSPRPIRSSWSSTTWASCASSASRSRCLHEGSVLGRRHRSTTCQRRPARDRSLSGAVSAC